MSYETALKISDVVDNIHKKKYLLPAIQREFVWNTFQIERLFDSIMRNYPISSFLFWQVDKESVNDYEFYEFLREFHERDRRHNLKADISGEEGITAILDGQQRLTSIYIALKGSFAEKLPRKRWDNDLAYPKKKLYLNLVRKSEDPELEYDFMFLTDEEALENNENDYWFRVGDILNLKEPGEVNSYLIKNQIFQNYKPDQAEFANNALFKLHNVIHITPLISYYKEQSQSLDKVLNIFIRINSGGTILSYSDLLLSIATAQWEEKDAREEIIKFVDEINDIGSGFNFNKDFVLKSSLVINEFSDFAFKVDNFNKANMLKIEQNWDALTSAIRIAVKLVSSFGYNRDTLTSNNAIIPIAYYLYKISATDSFPTSTRNLADKEKIKKWLILSLVKRAFSGQPDNVLRPIRKIILENHDSFPIGLIIDKFKGTTKSLLFSTEDIENLTHYKYGQGFTFSILSLLYPQLDYSNQFHIDHIFPKSLFTKSKLRKRGISEDDIETFYDWFNYIGNLQLIGAIPNIEKKDTEFKIWLNNIYPDQRNQNQFKEVHYIPNVELDFGNFIEFFEEREKLLKAEFSKILLIEEA
ncbi:DUF262 domain-containing protein [Pontimicrobium aquaticum]|uniref:DUF262 domain-containing protein n=1 Tax=Pontimicrobium aquaticum TaxID=2565367 RepID=A0A4U0EVN4_9FLAO|nr:DUF262 domain-containing protein [Pontimicrobium aquaticum]TJY35890.1 DUF262 domain-containing protein [Pontimicrobium aquaticum]